MLISVDDSIVGSQSLGPVSALALQPPHSRPVREYSSATVHRAFLPSNLQANDVRVQYSEISPLWSGSQRQLQRGQPVHESNGQAGSYNRDGA